MYRYELNRQFEKFYNSGYDPDLIPNNKVHDKRYVSLLTRIQKLPIDRFVLQHMNMLKRQNLS